MTAKFFSCIKTRRAGIALIDETNKSWIVGYDFSTNTSYYTHKEFTPQKLMQGDWYLSQESWKLRVLDNPEFEKTWFAELVKNFFLSGCKQMSGPIQIAENQMFEYEGKKMIIHSGKLVEIL